MLRSPSWSCRRYRAAFTPGRPETDHPHRFRCQACGEYAAALEKAAVAGRLVPISDRLRRRLESIPSSGAARVVRFPLPQAPLPDRLRERLREIPRQAEAPRPPAWILHPRYAVAASYLLAVLLTLALGNPMERARQAMDALSQELAAPIHRAGSAGRERLEALGELQEELQEELQDETRARYGDARRSLEESFSTFGSRVTEASRGLLSSDIIKIGPWASGSGPLRR